MALQRQAEGVQAEGTLYAGAATPLEEQQACAENTKLQAKAAELRNQLNPNAPSPGPNLAYMINDNPAALLKDTERDLAKLKKPGFFARHDERREQLLNRIKAAQERVKERTAELAAVESQIAELAEKMNSFRPDKMLPENFALVKAKKSADERRRETARAAGFSWD